MTSPHSKARHNLAAVLLLLVLVAAVPLLLLAVPLRIKTDQLPAVVAVAVAVAAARRLLAVACRNCCAGLFPAYRTPGAPGC